MTVARTPALCLLIAVLLGRWVDAVERDHQDPWTSPHARIQQVGLNDVRWTTGF